jgi:hypothetical protein
MLPPFNPWAVFGYGLDLVDDTDFSDPATWDATDDIVDDPDSQWPDNDGPLCDSIRNRIVPFDEALDVFWFREEKEVRFDTNLLEEKFTEPDERWMWINIETLPWDFTEFFLENVPNVDCDGVPGPDTVGDYILVSSFMTEDSEREIPMCCVYDFDASGRVDIADVLDIAGAWLAVPTDPEWDDRFDTDGDGDIDLADIMEVVACWDTDCP